MPATGSARTPGATTATSAPGPTTTKPTASAPKTAATTTTSPSALAETQALADLEEIRGESLGTVSLGGAWAAQLSSKYVGVVDPLGTASNGSHKFMATDIFDEHMEMRKAERFSGANIVLLKGTDFGKRSTVKGKTLWVTLAVGLFPDEESVMQFCQTAYPGKSGQSLQNVCMPRTLTPPHS